MIGRLYVSEGVLFARISDAMGEIGRAFVNENYSCRSHALTRLEMKYLPTFFMGKLSNISKKDRTVPALKALSSVSS